MQDTIINRRNFFKLSILASSALAVGNLGGGFLMAAPTNSKAHTHTHHKGASKLPEKLVRGRMFFQKQSEFDTLSAACERIYPKDEDGEGAIGLGVPYFIDNQLASGYGYNAREYMFGPFIDGKPEQGYQSPLYRRDIFLLGLEGLENTANSRYKKSFPKLSNAQQDSILKDFESGKVRLGGISSKYFFSLLRDMTLAGALADPIYQGNYNMNGWRMMEYPGAQMAYIEQVGSDKYVKVEPMGLADMQ